MTLQSLSGHGSQLTDRYSDTPPSSRNYYSWHFTQPSSAVQTAQEWVWGLLNIIPRSSETLYQGAACQAQCDSSHHHYCTSCLSTIPCNFFCYDMLWCSGMYFHYFSGCYDKKLKCRIVLQGEKWVGPKQFNTGLFNGKVIEKISL